MELNNLLPLTHIFTGKHFSMIICFEQKSEFQQRSLNLYHTLLFSKQPPKRAGSSGYSLYVEKEMAQIMRETGPKTIQACSLLKENWVLIQSANSQIVYVGPLNCPGFQEEVRNRPNAQPKTP